MGKNIEKFIKKHSLYQCLLIVAGFSAIAGGLAYILYSGIRTQIYHDIVVGNITIPGVNKDADFVMYFTVAIVYLVLFLWLYRRKNETSQRTISDKRIWIFIALLAVGIYILKIKNIAGLMIAFAGYLYCLLIFICENVEHENKKDILLIPVYIYLSLCGIQAVAVYYFPDIHSMMERYFVFVFIIILITYTWIIKKMVNNKKLDNGLAIFSDGGQLFIPLCIYGVINTQYYYRNAAINAPGYGNFEKLIIGIVGVLLIGNIVKIIWNRGHGEKNNLVFLSTLVAYTILLYWSTYYNLMISTDSFHMGETAIVYPQIVEFGQTWGEEFVSVLQGLGFIVSGLNELVFGGTYATYVQAHNLWLLVSAVSLVTVVYPMLKQKWPLLFIIPIMPFFFMNRIFFVATVFIILLNPKLIACPVKWTYAYILACIFHVWYQPTYGGGQSAAILVAGIYMWYHEYKSGKLVTQWKTAAGRIKYTVFIVSVALIGILCLPMLRLVFSFLKTNGAETRIGNGIGIFQSLLSRPNVLTDLLLVDASLQAFVNYGLGFMFCAAALVIYMKYVREEKNFVRRFQGFLLTVSAVFSYFLTLPASFTRMDNGVTRIGWTSLIYFCALLPMLIYIYWDKIKKDRGWMLLIGTMVWSSCYMMNPSGALLHQKTNAVVYVPDEAVFVTPKESGLGKLGNAYVGDLGFLHEAMALNEICTYLLNENQTYYDFTDKSIYYYLTGMKVPGKYVSSMVAANEELQKEVITRLRENDVPLIYMNKPLRYMGVSESLRAYRIYRYFMLQDYKYITYKDCDFLVRGDLDLSPLANEIVEYDISELISNPKAEISMDGFAKDIVKEFGGGEWDTLNDLVFSEENLQITGTDPFIRFQVDRDVEISELDVVEITLGSQDSMVGQLWIDTDKGASTEEQTLYFEIEKGHAVIPVQKFSVFHGIEGKVKNIRVDFVERYEEKVGFETIKLYKLNTSNRQELEKRYKEASLRVTDGRLDKAFYQADLGYLPSEWGTNWRRMENRFEGVKEFTQSQLEFIGEGIRIVPEIKGNEVEFLRISLGGIVTTPTAYSVKVTGLDTKGNRFDEKFTFKVRGNIALVPLASSPNCLKAEVIEEIEISSINGVDKNLENITGVTLLKLIK